MGAGASSSTFAADFKTTHPDEVGADGKITLSNYISQIYVTNVTVYFNSQVKLEFVSAEELVSSVHTSLSA